jgi:hypothetical protein
VLFKSEDTPLARYRWRRRGTQARHISDKYALQRLKAGANIVNFLTVNKVKDMAGLDDCFRAMIDKQTEIRDKLKPVQRKLATLEKHLEQSEYYKSYFKIMAQYRKLKAQAQTANQEKGFGAKKKAEKAQAAADSYYKDNSREIILCEAAETYLKGVLQKRFDPKKWPPIAKWTQDHANALAEKQQLDIEYQGLKKEVGAAQKIRSEVYSIMAREQRREQPRRAHDMER